MNQSVSRISVPVTVTQLGYAGLIPFVTLSVSLWVLPAGFHQPVNDALLAYAAIILSFMGAVHWGLAIATEDEPDKVQLAASVVPALVAWFATLAPVLINYSVLVITFAGLCVYDSRMAGLNKVPAWYPRLRMPLTAVVILSLLLAQISLL